jgi:hypothetical protein
MNLRTFEKQWMNHFASGISKEDIKKYVVSTGNYIWHVFSWKLLPEETYLVGDEARRAYDAADKKDAMYIDAFGDGVCKALDDKYEKAASLEMLTEVYVAAKDFSWTYIKTHEEDFCGPYFCRKNSEN